MPSVYQLKSRFQNILRPAVAIMARGGITANQVTIFTCLCSVSLGLYFYFFAPAPAFYFLIPIFFFIRLGLNAVDGMLAREHNMKSPLGAILNELTDVISDAFLYYPLADLWGLNSGLNALFVCLAILTEFVGVVAVQIGAERRYDGPFGKSDRAVVFGVGALLYTQTDAWTQFINEISIGLSLLLALTILTRARNALRTRR